VVLRKECEEKESSFKEQQTIFVLDKATFSQEKEKYEQKVKDLKKNEESLHSKEKIISSLESDLSKREVELKAALSAHSINLNDLAEREYNLSNRTRELNLIIDSQRQLPGKKDDTKYKDLIKELEEVRADLKSKKQELSESVKSFSSQIMSLNEKLENALKEKESLASILLLGEQNLKALTDKNNDLLSTLSIIKELERYLTEPLLQNLILSNFKEFANVLKKLQNSQNVDSFNK
jgi:chromosome segregation ATPase